MSPEMGMPEVIDRARQQMAQVTGLKPVTITGAHRDAEGWHVGIEMLEMSRIPPATDVLGRYEVLLDDRACMVSFDRKRTRLRGEPLQEQ
ncbi:MAG: gas vesicle protein [Chloroflexi bacterium]|nr:gas vesicle protein [Chloroflexota bacterium]